MAELLDRAVDFVMLLITENREDKWLPISAVGLFDTGQGRRAIEACAKPKSVLVQRGH